MYKNRSGTASTAYKTNFQKYFEGYTEVRTVMPDGRVKVDVVYTAPYWVQEGSDREWVLRKVCFLGLTAVALALYLVAAFMPLGGDYAKFVMLPGGITASILLFHIAYLLSYVFSPRKLTIYDFNRIHNALRRWPLLAAVGMGAAGILSVVYLFYGIEPNVSKVLLCAGCYFAAAVDVFMIHKTERNTEYFEEENESGITNASSF